MCFRVIWVLENIANYKGQDPSQSRDFWQKSLKGFTQATPVGSMPVAGGNDGEGLDHPEEEICLSERVTSSLRECARRHQVTLNTVVQGGWALLLSRTSGEEDVVFGATRACRHAPVEGIKEMVGIFI